LGAWLHAAEQFSGNIQGIGSILTSLAPALFNGITGLVIGGIAVAVSIPIQKLRSDR
jgi:predicted DNA repair protein MutK